MNLLNKLSIGVLVLAGLLVFIRMMVIKVEPGYIGVVNKEWTSGFVEKDFQPGFHLDLGPFHTWTVFDTKVQSLHRLRRNQQQQSSPEGDVQGPLEVKSKQGANVTMDLTVKYRIQPGKVWSVRRKFGPGQTPTNGYKKVVADRTDQVLRQTLGTLETAEFYDPNKRASVQAQMESALTTELAGLDVELIAILIRDLTFEAELEKSIKEQALADERVELNKSETAATEERGRTEKIRSETQAKVVIIDQEREKELKTLQAENTRKIEEIRANFQKQVTEMRSDADLYAAIKQADGTKLLKNAEADGQALRREALANAGGNTVVALELAKNLQFGALSVSTQLVNPLDVNAILDKLGVKQ